jgi:hypothetical protein
VIDQSRFDPPGGAWHVARFYWMSAEKSR